MAVIFDGYRLAPYKRWLYAALLRSAGVARIVGLTPRQPQGPDSAGRYPHIARIHLEQLAASGIDISVEQSQLAVRLDLPDAVRSAANAWLEPRRTRPGLPLVAICPGARSPANHWGTDRFIELGRRLLARGDCELVVCGGPAEKESAEHLISAWGQGIDAAGALPILETAALFERCAFMIGLDTGTTHLAAAVGTRCVVIQGGRTRPGNWDPLGPGHIVLRQEIECAGCGLTQCPLSRHPCMRAITVDAAMQAVGRMF